MSKFLTRLLQSVTATIPLRVIKSHSFKTQTHVAALHWILILRKQSASSFAVSKCDLFGFMFLKIPVKQHWFKNTPKKFKVPNSEQNKKNKTYSKTTPKVLNECTRVRKFDLMIRQQLREWSYNKNFQTKNETHLRLK